MQLGWGTINSKCWDIAKYIFTYKYICIYILFLLSFQEAKRLISISITLRVTEHLDLFFPYYLPCGLVFWTNSQYKFRFPQNKHGSLLRIVAYFKKQQTTDSLKIKHSHNVTVNTYMAWNPSLYKFRKHIIGTSIYTQMFTLVPLTSAIAVSSMPVSSYGWECSFDPVYATEAALWRGWIMFFAIWSVFTKD